MTFKEWWAEWSDGISDLPLNAELAARTAWDAATTAAQPWVGKTEGGQTRSDVQKILNPWIKGTVSFEEWCAAVDRIFPPEAVAMNSEAPQQLRKGDSQ